MSVKNTIEYMEFDDYIYHLYSEDGTNQLFLEIEFTDEINRLINNITLKIPPTAYKSLFDFLSKLDEIGVLD